MSVPVQPILEPLRICRQWLIVGADYSNTMVSNVNSWYSRLIMDTKVVIKHVHYSITRGDARQVQGITNWLSSL